MPLKRLKEAGQFAALQLEIFVGAESPLLLDKYSLTGFTGLKLFIGNNTFKTVYEDQQEILILLFTFYFFTIYFVTMLLCY